MSTVIKIGGSSLANGLSVKDALSVVHRDPSVSAVVVSAPGKRSGIENDTKVTDLLLSLHYALENGNESDVESLSEEIRKRYLEIGSFHAYDSFELMFDDVFRRMFDQLQNITDATQRQMYTISRGEYLMALLFAKLLNWEFVDATEIIRFNNDGTCAWDLCESLIHEKLLLKKGEANGFVVPGFYGADLNGESIHVFPRNGSDISGAIVAAGMGADEYKNWTDADGLSSVDPRLIPGAPSIGTLSYEEAREATYGGMGALHPLALYPVEMKDIPTVVRNVKNPGHPGTRITTVRKRNQGEGPFMMVTGRDGFSCITITMPLMNETLGFVHQATGVLVNHSISLERLMDQADVVSLVVDSQEASEDSLVEVVIELQKSFPQARIKLEHDVALVVVLGAGMKNHVGVAKDVIAAVADIGVSNKLITQPLSETSITIGVSSYRLDDVVRAIYHSCINPPVHSIIYPA